MKDEIKRACAALEINPDLVLSSRIDNELGQVFIVVDRGIKGSPKLSIALADLPAPKPVSTPKEEAPKPVPKRRSRAKKAS